MHTKSSEGFISSKNIIGVTINSLLSCYFRVNGTIDYAIIDEVGKCNFAEYRTWVIINLLLNNGCRAATIRNIKIKDVDLDNLVIYLRHTKNKKLQVIPLCSELCSILREYLKIRSGSAYEYLFPNENGEQLKEDGLRSSITRYNNRRGIEKTSIHAFRHTFARKY